MRQARRNNSQPLPSSSVTTPSIKLYPGLLADDDSVHCTHTALDATLIRLALDEILTIVMQQACLGSC